MKIRFTAFLITSLSWSFSQNTDSTTIEFTPKELKVWNMPGASFGTEFYRDKNLQNYFGDSLHSNFGQSNLFVALDHMVSVDYSADIHFGLNYMMPVTTVAFDTLNYTLQGYSLSLGSSFKPFENRYFQFPLHGGYRFGHIYIKEENLRMKNFFFDLYLEANPRLILFNKLVIFACGTLNWDITKQHWKSKTLTPGSNLNFKHTNGSFQIGLAWKFESTSDENDEEGDY